MYELKESIGMWRLIGLQTNKIYFEAETKAEVNRWRVSHFRNEVYKGPVRYDSTEPLGVVHVL